jgi:hypothetical protein
VAGGAVAALRAALDVLVGVDPQALGDAALVEGVEALVAAEHVLRAVQSGWLAVIDAREATVAECGRATRSWLVEELRVGPVEASRRLRLARSLPGCPLTAAALAAGEVGAEHAGVITAAVGELPAGCAPPVRAAVESALVELAGSQPPFVLARAVDELRVRFGVEDSAETAYARRYARRGVCLDRTFAGFGSLAGTLSPDVADALGQALTATSAPAGPDDVRSAAQRRHDGLGEIAAFYLAHADLPAHTGERPRVVVTIDHATLLGQLQATGRLDSGATIPATVARRLACDAELLPVTLGTRSEILDIGTTSRSWPTAIRRAAWIRDHGHCAYPRCRRPPADLHHIHHVNAGGPTNLDNAAWLCTFHHWLIHEHHWTIHRNPDNTYTFTPPPPPHRQPQPA